ncbi:glycosyltransferase family 87 protein [Streptomyces sp. NEAU-Y11]|uniref:glycosyltransferase family 87 protein n=1 Tax=Streptomyces cucumeris TaxID=2962890 RepID=UPI0020C8737A|nr:glycosyltransferase 87 family protein [Streptomyces sp. NEAU-Y11]MCP9212782.1 glycosyltransferase 87 family protein [Streptomyces sp. NEAU-Y11]
MSVREDPQAQPVRPTDEDPVARAASEVIGGPVGRRALLGTSWWTPVRIIALVAIGMFALGMAQKMPCYDGGWFFGNTAQYTHACYSDIPHLYSGRGFADDLVPYFHRIPQKVSGGMEYLEYPVLTGLFMEVASWLTPHDGTSQSAMQHREQIYWMVNAGMLMVCAAVMAVCVTRTHRRRPWDGMFVALAPAFALTATINWDLFAVALTAAALLMWSRGRPLTAGILLGLATAAKFYPLLLLGPLFLLCLRTGRWWAFWSATGGAVAAWLVVNVPVMIDWRGGGPHVREGWKMFYTFSQERPVDFGSVWLIVSQRADTPMDDVNTYATAMMVLACIGVAALALCAPRRPRLAQLAFLIVAAFVVTNKVYSPQYVLWLIPLAALARPRWRDFLVWQACEVMYFLGIWMYLAYTGSGDQHRGLPPEGYQLAIVLHVLGTLYLCALVVRDALMPERDPVRQDGSDDPSGGVLDGAPDVFVLGEARRRARYEGAAMSGWGTERG